MSNDKPKTDAELLTEEDPVKMKEVEDELQRLYGMSFERLVLLTDKVQKTLIAENTRITEVAVVLGGMLGVACTKLNMDPVPYIRIIATLMGVPTMTAPMRAPSTAPKKPEEVN